MTTRTVSSPSDVQSASRVAWRYPVMVFLSVAVGLTAVISLSAAHLPQGDGHRNPIGRFDAVLGPWTQFDAGWYAIVAEHGYDAAQVAAYDAKQESAAGFFPAYPLVVRAVEPLTGDVYLAESAVTLAAGLLLMVAFLQWCSRRESADAARMAVLSLLLFPYGYYLVATGYGDAMFLLATVLAFMFLERDRPVMAGLAGAVATGTRPVGIAVIIGLVVLALERRGAVRWRPRPRLDLTRLRRADAGVLLAAVGAGAFMVFEWIRFGSPFAYSIAQRGWNQSLNAHTVLKIEFFNHVLHDPNPGNVLRLTLEAVLALLFVAALPQVWKRYGPGYGSYTVVVIAIPLIGSGSFISVGRYVLAAFPVFALLGAWLADMVRPRAIAFLVLSAIGLLTIASFYGRSYFMA